ncbi:MAG TPA: type II toxin-antitoxin system death-on-curing family toxin [Candidatus Paceibacterota bacterium]
MRTKKITVTEVEYAAFSLARKLMTWDEPIPDFGTRFPNVLESCIEAPFGRFSKKDLYRGIIGKGSILFYLVIKNHPFQNGNKRIAVMSLLYFLYKNGKWLKMSNVALYNFAKGIAKSKPASREKIIFNIQEKLGEALVDWEDSK